MKLKKLVLKIAKYYSDVDYMKTSVPELVSKEYAGKKNTN
jgi:gamma-glutamyltranspeptidase